MTVIDSDDDEVTGASKQEGESSPVSKADVLNEGTRTDDESVPPGPDFAKQDLVTKRDGDGTVGFVVSAAPTREAGETWYVVQFGASRESCRASHLRRFVESPDLATLLSSDSYGGPDAFRRHITAVKLKMQLTDTLYSYGASRTELYPYQFVPLLKFLSSPYRRILIADEVGLGKTIEAGYLLQEELARGRLSRVLVVCPASLRVKWQEELLNRFGHRFDILDAAAARERVPLGDGERAGHPLRGIVSFQSIRTTRFIDEIASSASPIDLLVVDEAHHCRNILTLQAQAVSALVDQADAVTFLSATPIQTSERNLFTLLHMLVPEEFPSEAGFEQRLRLNRPIVRAETLLRQKGADRLAAARESLKSLESEPDGAAVTGNPLFRELLKALDADAPDTPARRVELQERLNPLNLLSSVFTRTKRRDVQLAVAHRKAFIPEARLTDAEREAYDSISDFLFEEYERRHGDGAAGFILTTYQRQLASSLPAAVRKFRDAVQASGTDWDAEIETSETELDEAPGGDRYRPADDPQFREIVLGIDLGELESGDTKYGLLLESLQHLFALVDSGERASRKLIVFSYFRRSLDYLERRLAADGFRCVRIDGSVKSTPGNPDTDERQRRIVRFREDASIDIMLTSEVGSEGLDFQFCDAMVNWDLPWNPMVVEQRIGRIDRIGQKSPQITVVNLACKGTIEARILRRLYERIGIFEHSIGELEPILGDLVRDLERELFRPRLTEEEQIRILNAREIAIENARRRQQQLEKQAELLIGHDEFFRAKLDRIRRLGRYVGGSELRLFADNELRAIAPGLAFEHDDEPGVFRLAYRPEVERLIEADLPRGDEEGMRFLGKYRRGVLRVAFDGQVAERHPGVEPLHAQHPLIRAMAARLEPGVIERPQVASLSVRSGAVPPGAWFYLCALVIETGFLAARSLMCAVIDLREDSLTPADLDAGDELLADVLREGSPWANFNPPDRDAAERCLKRAEQEIQTRVDDLDRKRGARMETIKAARRGTVEATYQVRLERQSARVADMERRAPFEPGASQILPATRGRLEQIERDRAVKLASIDELEQGSVSYKLLGAGFVNVTAPPDGKDRGRT